MNVNLHKLEQGQKFPKNTLVKQRNEDIICNVRISTNPAFPLPLNKCNKYHSFRNNIVCEVMSDIFAQYCGMQTHC
jgi:hypothetical protein